MDTSKKYIEMCEKAEEIQKGWKPKRGDFYTVVVHGKAGNIINVYIDGFPCLPQGFIPLSELYICLPRQDQLQEIIPQWDNFYIVRSRKKYKQRSLGRDLLICNSMEQLWLAFVMKEKYKKIWDGEKWTKKG